MEGKIIYAYIEEESMRARGMKLKSMENISSEVSDGFMQVGFKEKPTSFKPF